MFRTLTRSLLVIWLALMPVSLRADDQSAKKIAELEKEITRLKAELNRLGEQLEGTGKPINLARTSLASVRASSVNGGRDLANKYYGIRNAFDNGDNWINSINYSWWLADGNLPQYIEIQFDLPVTVARIEVESKLTFATRFTSVKGGVEDHPAAQQKVDFAHPLGGVQRIRLTFVGHGAVPANQLDSGQVRVDEVRIMGHIPAGTKYTVGTPRLWLTTEDTVSLARSELQIWASRLSTTAIPEVKEEEQRTVITFLHGDTRRAMFRVTVSKVTNQITVEPLVLTPVNKRP